MLFLCGSRRTVKILMSDASNSSASLDILRDKIEMDKGQFVPERGKGNPPAGWLGAVVVLETQAPL